MSRAKPTIILIMLILTAIISSTGEAALESMSLNKISVSDLTNTEKTSFNTGDYIRYSVEHTSNFRSAVFVRGTVVYENGEIEKLGMQFQTVKAGDHRLFWDSVSR